MRSLNGGALRQAQGPEGGSGIEGQLNGQSKTPAM
jgi:hypothetical protein